jgi:penicillin-binding protein 1C
MAEGHRTPDGGGTSDGDRMPEGAPVSDGGIEPNAAARAPGGQRVFSPGASFLTRRTLELRDRPDFPARRALTGAPPRIHWKTGTSFGHRDAWAAGSGPRYTAAVWLGNLDGSPSVDRVGADAAGPVLFDLLEALAGPDDPVPAANPPPDLKYVEVCAYSGRAPTPACDHTRPVLALRRAVPTAKCPYHVLIDIDTATGLALTPACRAGHAYRSQPFLVWPASLRRFLKDEHRTLPEPPAWAPGCETPGTRRRPSILSPAAGEVAILIQGLAADRQEIPLEAESAASGHLSWFVDGAFLGTVAAEERLWWTPKVGKHELVVTDDAGLSARRTLEVRARP